MNEQPLSKGSSPYSFLTGNTGWLLMATLFVVGLVLGFGVGRWSGEPLILFGQTSTGTAHGERPTSAKAALYNDFPIFWEALDLIYRDFDGEVADPQTVTYDAIRGVVDNLDDPNTSFLTPDEADFFRSSMEGSFEGIGARVDWDEELDTVRIVEPFADQPAARAGLKRDDLILAVDGESIVGTSLNEALRKIRGPKGTTVTLTVERAGESAPFELAITRDRIETPTIITERLGDAQEIAYVRLTTFNQNSGELTKKAIEDALKLEPKGLIFDLRGNSGGLLSQAVTVSSLFLQDKTVLIERFANGDVETYETEGRAVATEIPMVVLVNEGSASASEIVAGALQDHQRAELIGTTTYGKGSVQLPHNLSDGSIMRVTIARWYTPLDRTIDGTGLEPDQVVTLPEDANLAEIELADDPQVVAAIKLLAEQLAQ